MPKKFPENKKKNLCFHGQNEALLKRCERLTCEILKDLLFFPGQSSEYVPWFATNSLWKSTNFPRRWIDATHGEEEKKYLLHWTCARVEYETTAPLMCILQCILQFEVEVSRWDSPSGHIWMNNHTTSYIQKVVYACESHGATCCSSGLRDDGVLINEANDHGVLLPEAEEARASHGLDGGWFTL